MNSTIRVSQDYVGTTQSRHTYIIPVGIVTTKQVACKTIKSLLEKNRAADVVLIHRDPDEVNKQKLCLQESGITEPPIVIDDGANLHLQMLVAVNKANMKEKNIVFVVGHTEYAMVSWIIKYLLVWSPDLKCTICKIHDDTPFVKSVLIRIKNYFVRLCGFRRYRSVWRA